MAYSQVHGRRRGTSGAEGYRRKSRRRLDRPDLAASFAQQGSPEDDCEGTGFPPGLRSASAGAENWVAVTGRSARDFDNRMASVKRKILDFDLFPEGGTRAPNCPTWRCTNGPGSAACTSSNASRTKGGLQDEPGRRPPDYGAQRFPESIAGSTTTWRCRPTGSSGARSSVGSPICHQISPTGRRFCRARRWPPRSRP